MQPLILIPTTTELNCFIDGCQSNGIPCQTYQLAGKSAFMLLPSNTLIASGGLGKVQFGVQTRYFLDHLPDCKLVICAGAAGALIDELSIGDIVIGVETVEHDLRKKSRPWVPRFPGDIQLIQKAKTIFQHAERVFYGAIASGDEDIMDRKRRQAVRKLTGAAAVAWEGAGGARACQLTQTPFIEIRVIVDAANTNAASDFKANLNQAMTRLAAMILRLL